MTEKILMEMSKRERFNRSMHFQAVDSVINFEFGYWDETIRRWREEGLPHSCSPVTFGESESDDPMAKLFNMDMHWLSGFAPVNCTDPVPLFEEEVLEEDAETKTVRKSDGVLMRIMKNSSSVPQYLKFPVESRKDFEEYKLRFDPSSPERYPDDWDELVAEYARRDYHLGLNMNGFFGTLRKWMGFENLGYAWYDQPDLMKDMCDYWADFNIKASQRVFDEVELDFVHFWEDMAFNHGPMVSPSHFRQFFGSAYKKVVDFIKSQSVDVIIVDSDGLIEELIPLFLEVGINSFLPIEIAAGNDPLRIRKKYGKDVRLLGGIDKRALIKGPEAIEAELRGRLPFLLSQGGYIPAVDHLVPPDVSLENYKYYMQLKAELIGGRV